VTTISARHARLITPYRRTISVTKAEIKAAALANATQNQSVANYDAIFERFMEKGIPEEDIEPRVNVFTYNAWLALGRRVKRGEHGVKITTWIGTSFKDEETGERKPGKRRPKTTTVFHISQTEPVEK